MSKGNINIMSLNIVAVNYYVKIYAKTRQWNSPMNKMKIKKRHWFIWLITSLAMYIVFYLQEIAIAPLGWFLLLFNNLILFVVVFPFLEALFPDDKENYSKIRNLFGMLYTLLTIVPLIYFIVD